MLEINTVVTSMTQDITAKHMGIPCHYRSGKEALQAIFQYLEWIHKDQTARTKDETLALNHRVRDLREISKEIVKRHHNKIEQLHWIRRLVCFVVIAIKSYFIQRQAQQIDSLANRWLRNHCVVTMTTLPQVLIGCISNYLSIPDLIATGQTSTRMHEAVTKLLIDRAKTKYGFQASRLSQLEPLRSQLTKEFNSIIHLIKTEEDAKYSKNARIPARGYSIESLVKLSRQGKLPHDSEDRELLSLLFAFSIAENKRNLVNFLMQIHKTLNFDVGIKLSFAKRISFFEKSYLIGTPLKLAAEVGNADAVKFLCANIPEANLDDALQIAIKKCSLNVIPVLLAQPALRSDPTTFHKLILYSVKERVSQPILSVLSKTNPEANGKQLQAALQIFMDDGKPFYLGELRYTQQLGDKQVDFPIYKIVSFFLLHPNSDLNNTVGLFLNKLGRDTFFDALERIYLGYSSFHDLNTEENFARQVSVVKKLLEHCAQFYPDTYNGLLYSVLDTYIETSLCVKCLLHSSSLESLTSTLNEALLKDNQSVANTLLSYGVQPDPDIAIRYIGPIAKLVATNDHIDLYKKITPDDSFRLLISLLFSSKCPQLSPAMQILLSTESIEGSVQKAQDKYNVRPQDLLELILFLKTETFLYDCMDESVFNYFSHKIVTELLKSLLFRGGQHNAECMLRHGAKPDVEIYQYALTQRFAAYFYHLFFLNETDWAVARFKLYSAIENLMRKNSIPEKALPILPTSAEQVPEEVCRALNWNWTVINNINYCLTIFKEGKEANEKLYSRDEQWFS